MWNLSKAWWELYICISVSIVLRSTKCLESACNFHILSGQQWYLENSYTFLYGVSHYWSLTLAFVVCKWNIMNYNKMHHVLKEFDENLRDVLNHICHHWWHCRLLLRQLVMSTSDDKVGIMTTPGPVFCLLLGVSSGCAQPTTGQVTSVTWPVIGWA